MSVQRWVVVPAAVALVSLVLACGKADDGGGGGPSLPTAPTPAGVTITRTGGIAGVNEKVEISADGSWVYTDVRSYESQQGSLTAAQRLALLQLVSDPSFAAELQRPQKTGTCSDTFRYTISSGDLSASYEDGCGDNRPAVDAVIKAVADATPL